MSFIASANRFLAPIKQAEFETFLQTIYYMTWPISGIVSVNMLKEITISIQSGSEPALRQNMIFFGGFIVLYNLRLFIGRKWTWVRMTETYVKIIQSEYIPHFLGLDNNYTDKKGTGYLISAFEKGIYQRSESIQNVCRYSSIFLVSIIFIIYSFYQLPILLNLGVIGVLVSCVAVIIYLSNKLRPLRIKENEFGNYRSKNMVKIIMSKMEIVQNNQGSQQVDSVNSISNNIIGTKRKRANYIYFMYNLPEVLISLIQFTIFGMIGYGVLQGKYTLGDLVLLSGSIMIVSTTLSEFTTFYKDFFKDFGKVEQLRKLVDEGGKIDYSIGKTFNHQHGNISFNKVSYSYSPSKPVFQHFNLSIIGGKKTALVGPSGGGKSTLIKLIAGYIRPDEGNIIIDGQNLSETSLKSYYKHIGYLTQEPSVFDGTIRENLMYGISLHNDRRDVGLPRPGTNQIANDKEDGATPRPYIDINNVITLSRCEWIYDLPQGLDTEIGEKGVRLSGGQRQRLAIAKIMLKNPDIILLDEPTSALDSENEELVTQALDNLFKNKTVVVVAHRLQTVKHADQILFIDRNDVGKHFSDLSSRAGPEFSKSQHSVYKDPGSSPGGQAAGSIVFEQGTHEELLKMKGKYYKMVELQSGF